MRGIRRLVLVIGALVLASLAAAWVSDRAGYDPRLWLQDLDALEQHMGIVYANLEWVVEHRGLKLPAAVAQLPSAKSSPW